MSAERNSEIRQLVLAKSIYLHGCNHASCKDSVSRMLAIHHFDNAIEMVLKCAAGKQGLTPERRHFYFEELLEKVSDLPLKNQVKDLHQARNIVQHQGDIPSVESVIKYQGYTEDFLRGVCSGFGVLYEELSLSGLLERESLREPLLKAEQAFERGEFRECIELCDGALMAAVFEDTDLFRNAGALTSYWGASKELEQVLSTDYAEKYKEKEYYNLVRDFRGAILRLGQATTTMQFLGEYRMQFLKHRRIAEATEDASDEELRGNAAFCLSFVINLFLKWQEEGVL